MALRAWALALGASTIAQCAEGKAAQLYQSAADTGDRLADKGSVPFVPDFPFEGPVVSVSRMLDQHVVGFGGAFTEASALVWQGLPEAQQQQLLEMYFGQSGIGYTVGRIHINSCDFSPANYALDDVADDWELKNFDWGLSHDTQAMIPLVKAAKAVVHSNGGRELKLLATPWSPPAWMKTSWQMDGSDRPGLRDECKAVWAQYFSKWIGAYKAQGIPIWAITPQNEPENVARWEACVYTPEQELAFISEHLGPTLRADHPEVKILLFDHNKNHIEKWAQALYSNPKAQEFTDGIAFHWYTGDQFDQVSKIHEEHPKAFLFATEATYEQYRWKEGSTMAVGDWTMGLGYAHDILNDLNAGASGWLDWNLILDQHGGPNHVDNVCDAAMIGDGDSGELYIHPQYYTIGHFSKYIIPGSQRLEASIEGSWRYEGETRDYGTCDGADGLEATAFLRPDSLITIVVLNCGANQIDYKLKDGSLALRATVPARGLHTFLLDADASAIIAQRPEILL